jgi:hypothetical protein
VQRAALKPRIIYKTFEIVDGRAIPRLFVAQAATGIVRDRRTVIA